MSDRYKVEYRVSQGKTFDRKTIHVIAKNHSNAYCEAEDTIEGYQLDTHSILSTKNTNRG